LGSKWISTLEGDAMKRVRFTGFLLVAISFGTILSLQRVRAGDGPARIPVLVELFTSEGCSDCPPADAVLEKLDRLQPVRGAELVVLSEHVDYWDGIGWRDPYSSHEYSERQQGYAERFGLDSVYTPQVVVDGHAQLVGSDERSAIRAIEDATKTQKTTITLSSIHLQSDGTLALRIDAGRLPPSVSNQSANILLAIADESDESSVRGGENAGRRLKHVAVVRSLTRVGKVDGTDGISTDVTVKVNGLKPDNFRVVAVAQEATTGRVWGVGMARISN
jgi:hypothetical protein